jgi:hypothetical protein
MTSLILGLILGAGFVAAGAGGVQALLVYGNPIPNIRLNLIHGLT